jgi:hypothetical protein
VEEALDPPAGPDDEAKAIGFGTFLDRVPQNGIKPLASILDIDWLKGSNPAFRVQAYKHAQTDWNAWTDGARTATPNFMENQAVKWSGGTSTSASWTYSPIQYWPGDKVSFFAYTPPPGPYTTVTFALAEAAGKNPKLYYTMPSTYASQMDLVVDAECNLTGDADKVTFKFDHVLSRIGFQAKLKNDYAPATVTMSGMTFTYNGLKISGTYTFNSGTYTGSNKDPINWEVTDGRPGSYTLNLIASSSTLSTTDPFDISGTARYLMLIPQENPDKTAYVRVAYTIDYPDDSGHSDVIVPSVATPDNIVYLPPITWEPGIAYTYTLYIAGPREMIFHVDEKIDWGSEVPDDIFHFYPLVAGNGEGGTGNGKNPFSVFRSPFSDKAAARNKMRFAR